MSALLECECGAACTTPYCGYCGRGLDVTDSDIVGNFLKEVERELREAMTRFPAFNSPHEGYAIILGKLDELWDEVKVKPSSETPVRMRRETVQVAAMALRFLYDISYEACG